MLNGADEEPASAKSVVNDQRNTCRLTYLRDSLKVGDVVLGISDTLDIDSFCLIVDSSSNVVGVVALDKLGFDAETREENLELVVGSAVEEGGGDNVVAGMAERRDGHELGGLAGGGGDGRHPTFESCNALFEDVDGGL